MKAATHDVVDSVCPTCIDGVSLHNWLVACAYQLLLSLKPTASRANDPTTVNPIGPIHSQLCVRRHKSPGPTLCTVGTALSESYVA